MRRYRAGGAGGGAAGAVGALPSRVVAALAVLGFPLLLFERHLAAADPAFAEASGL